MWQPLESLSRGMVMCCLHRANTVTLPLQFRLDVITDEEVVTAYLLQDSVNDEKNPNQNLVIGFHIMQVSFVLVSVLALLELQLFNIPKQNH